MSLRSFFWVKNKWLRVRLNIVEAEFAVEFCIVEICKLKLSRDNVIIDARDTEAVSVS